MVVLGVLRWRYGWKEAVVCWWRNSEKLLRRDDSLWTVLTPPKSPRKIILLRRWTLCFLAFRMLSLLNLIDNYPPPVFSLHLYRWVSKKVQKKLVSKWWVPLYVCAHCSFLFRLSLSLCFLIVVCKVVSGRKKNVRLMEVVGWWEVARRGIKISVFVLVGSFF